MNNPVLGGLKIGDVWLHGEEDKIYILTDEGLKPADGSLVSRKKNPILYSVIGTAFCDEDLRCCNSELFALPNHEDNPTLRALRKRASRSQTPGIRHEVQADSSGVEHPASSSSEGPSKD